MAENYLIYYMFKDNMVINMVENKVDTFQQKILENYLMKLFTIFINMV